MLGAKSAMDSFMERYPRTSAALYQLLLGVVAFACWLSIARYDHNPNGSAPLFLSPTERNATHEHICKMSAREADFPVGALRYVIPYFMLCPSTLTLIGMCIAFIVCIAKWGTFQSDTLTEIMPYPVILMVPLMKWTDILVSVQMLLPMDIWICYFVRALFDPLFKWAMPGTYARLLDRKREARRLAEEKWKKKMIEDVELGEPTHSNEQTPLTGCLFARDVPSIILPQVT